MAVRSYRIGKLEIQPALVLAPMSGVTSAPFRRLIKQLNPGAVGLVFTEFVSVEAMTRRVPRTLEMLRLFPDERPAGIQIFGYDVDRMRDGARMAEDSGADVIDINCGCPAPKVVKKGGGCELMRQPRHLARILSEVRKAVTAPLTLKMRSGWDLSSLNALEIARIAEDSGIDAIAIHGRTRSQLYRGTADWEIVELVAAQVGIPVLGSGDVVDYPSAESRLPQAGGGNIAGLFIGRGALMNPHIFSDILAKRGPRCGLEHSIALAVLERYARLLEEQFSPKVCVGRFKQLVSQMGRGHAWRKDLCRASTWDEQKSILSILSENFAHRRQLEESQDCYGKRIDERDKTGYA